MNLPDISYIEYRNPKFKKLSRRERAIAAFLGEPSYEEKHVTIRDLLVRYTMLAILKIFNNKIEYLGKNHVISFKWKLFRDKLDPSRYITWFHLRPNKHSVVIPKYIGTNPYKLKVCSLTKNISKEFHV